MRKTIAFLSVAAAIASVTTGEAQTPRTFPTGLAVVKSGKMSRIGFTTNLTTKCELESIPEIDVVTPPSNGKVFTKRASGYPFYSSNSDRYACSKLKVPGIEILYESNPGFTGTDTLVVRMIDQNHFPSLKPYTIQVE